MALIFDGVMDSKPKLITDLPDDGEAETVALQLCIGVAVKPLKDFLLIQSWQKRGVANHQLLRCKVQVNHTARLVVADGIVEQVTDEYICQLPIAVYFGLLQAGGHRYCFCGDHIIKLGKLFC